MSSHPDPRVTDHLANERTFLAWFRTALTLIALGVAAGQFLALDVEPGFPLVRTLSTILVATGALVIAVGTYRYRENRIRIDAREFRPAGSSVLLAAAAALATAALAVAFIWLIPRG